MSKFKPETIIEIAERFSDMNIFISLHDQNQTAIGSTAVPFDNKTLKKLLEDQQCAVKEFIFIPRNRSFLVRLHGDGKLTASSVAHPREYQAMFLQIEIILERSETENHLTVPEVVRYKG